ncbi:DNA gyrase inhibitor YacG [Massilia sp. Root335]
MSLRSKSNASANKYRPCRSERCKQIDLGTWAGAPA